MSQQALNQHTAAHVDDRHLRSGVMPGEHVFVDESKRGGYVMAAAVVPGEQVRAVEAGLRQLLLPGQRSIHFKREKEGRRRSLLADMAEFGIQVTIYVRPSGPHVPARAACLEAIAEDHALAADIFLDLSEGDRAADERVLTRMRRKSAGTFRFHHEQPHQRPCLWIADAVAWSWAHGGQWRQLARPLTANTQTV